MSRDDLLGINLKVMDQVGAGLKKYAPNAFVICITNPLDAMVWALQKSCACQRTWSLAWRRAGLGAAALFPGRRVQRVGRGRQRLRARGHGDTMVPMARYSTVAGIPLPT